MSATSNPFDYINAINYTKMDIMSGTLDDVQAEKSYVPFITNRTLSYFSDGVMYANEMNMYAHLDNKLQFAYLINTIRPRKRYTKWAKKLENDDLSAIKQYYQYNDVKAEYALSLLSPDEIETIKLKVHRGRNDDHTADSVRS